MKSAIFCISPASSSGDTVMEGVLTCSSGIVEMIKSTECWAKYAGRSAFRTESNTSSSGNFRSSLVRRICDMPTPIWQTVTILFRFSAGWLSRSTAA
ncbi:hypothetical protein D3C76_1624240 [compost metagenome]